MLKSGDKAPLSEVVSDTRESVRLEDSRGDRAIVYFCPKTGTPGCTKQARAIRDIGPQLRDAGVTVIGILPDSPEHLARFRAKYKLDFILASDPEHVIAEEYGAWGEKSMYGKVYKGILRSHAAIGEESGTWRSRIRSNAWRQPPSGTYGREAS
jgi:thioredoxin-dependent peroxiredoxin